MKKGSRGSRPDRGKDRPRNARSKGGSSPAPKHQHSAGSEITAKVRHLSEFIDRVPPELVKDISSAQVGTSAIRTRGSEVIDFHLFSRSGRPVAAQVVTIDAYPHREHPGLIVVRLEGWDGHLELTLTRHRALLLARRLMQAVEASSITQGPESEPSS